MKKTAFVLSALLMLLVLTIGATLPSAADSNTVSGTWGNLTWTFNESTGELIISGEGKMNDFSYSSAAWRSCCSSAARAA